MEEEDGEWKTQKKKTKPKKSDVGMEVPRGRSSDRARRLRGTTRDVVAGRKQTLETSFINKKWCLSWNVRGLNSSLKESVVKHYIFYIIN